MTLTREQIRANRQTWIDFLRKPGRKKATSFLDNGNGARCCLGHGCYALDITRTRDAVSLEFCYGDEGNAGLAPLEFIDGVGLYDDMGTSFSAIGLGEWGYSALSIINDETDATPQQIGEYLQSVIEGGPDTPFRPLSEYPIAAIGVVGP